MKKLLFRVVLGLVLLGLLAVGAGLVFLDPLVGAAIGAGASYATGVEAKVESVDVGLTGGSFELAGLHVSNPAGFAAPHFLQLGQLRARCESGSVLSKQIVMQEFTLERLDLALERNADGANWSRILDHLEQVSGPKSKAPEDEPGSGSERSLAIRRIEIRGVKVELRLSGVPIGAGTHKLELPPIVIEEFRTDGSTLELIATLTRAIVTAVLEQSARSGGGVFPKDVLASLDAGLAGLKKKLGDEVRGELEKHLGSDALKAIPGIEELFKKP